LDCLQPISLAPENERLGYRSKSWLRVFFKDRQISFGMWRSIQASGKWEKEFVSWNTCPMHHLSIQVLLTRFRRYFAEAMSQELQTLLEAHLQGFWIASPHVVIISNHPMLKGHLDRLPWESLLEAPLEKVGFHVNPGVGRKIFTNGPVEPVWQDPLCRDKGQGQIPIKVFRQVAQTLLAEARNQAARQLLESQPDMVLDLYCGTGELSRLLPAAVGWLGIELSRKPCSTPIR
jgi:tRNA/tmRNA/rRNA uracil-C5-methylase (TrmA/RlmC/RlmD family)